MILGTATNGATKTRLMYGAYPSYTQVQEYLAFLQRESFAHVSGGSAEAQADGGASLPPCLLGDKRSYRSQQDARGSTARLGDHSIDSGAVGLQQSGTALDYLSVYL